MYTPIPVWWTWIPPSQHPFEELTVPLSVKLQPINVLC